MTENGMRALLDAGVPEPPDGLLAPPLAAIRHRVRRRRIAATGAAALSVVAAVGAGVAVRDGTGAPAPQAASPSVDAPSPSVDAPPAPSTFVVVGLDDRSLHVVSAPYEARETCTGATADVVEDGGTVVVNLRLPRATPPACLADIPVTLPRPLGTRAVVDGHDGTPLRVLHERVLPRPGYPAGMRLDPETSPLARNAPRPAWMVFYVRADGLRISVEALPYPLPLPAPLGRVTVHGHDMTIQGWPGAGQVGSAWWMAEGWQVFVVVEPKSTATGPPRDELRRILDGLVWP